MMQVAELNPCNRIGGNRGVVGVYSRGCHIYYLGTRLSSPDKLIKHTLAYPPCGQVFTLERTL